MLEKTKEIVRRAATLMMSADFAIEQKDGCANIVTSSDIAVQDFLCRELSQLLPGSGFLCEETTVANPGTPGEETAADNPGAPGEEATADGNPSQSGTYGAATSSTIPADGDCAGSVCAVTDGGGAGSVCAVADGCGAGSGGTVTDGPGYVWIIDPIDGTCNYSRGIDACAISVALRKGEEMVLGVVYSPARGEMYWAVRGQGAFCNGRQLHTSSRSFENSLLCTAMSTYRKEYADLCSEAIMDVYHQCNDVRRFGVASLELCFLAAGLCELYFELRLQPWDYAAAMLILQEAGGVLSSLDGTAPRFEGPDLVCAASCPEHHARLLAILRSHIPAIPYTD